MSDNADYRLILAALEAANGRPLLEMAQAVWSCLNNADYALILAALQHTAGKPPTQAQAVWRALVTGKPPTKPEPWRRGGSVPRIKTGVWEPKPEPARVHKIANPLTTKARREVVAELAGKGLSQRKIAAITGVDQSTVRRDLRTMNLTTRGRSGRRRR